MTTMCNRVLVALALFGMLLALPLDAAAQNEDGSPAPAQPAATEPAPTAGPPPTPAGPPPTPVGPPPPPVEDEYVDDGDLDGEDDGDDDEDDHHKGFFFRFTLGLGWGWLNGDGTLPPARGLQAIEDPEHNSPVFNLALSLGGGFLDLALHLGVLYERMIIRDRDPEKMGLSLFGIGGGLSYYFTDYDFFATAQVRLIGLALYLPDVICNDYYADKWEWYKGPGFALTLGKEWYEDDEDEGGIGLGIQGNYAYLTHSSDVRLHYFSLLLVLTLTHF